MSRLDAECLDHLLTWVQAGVYVNHTGAPSRRQLEWAAVLHYWPAALTHESALPTPTTSGPVHVAVAADRTVRRVAGVTTHRTAGFDARVQWIKSPPRLAYEHAAIDVASAQSDVTAAFQVLADACQTRETTAAAITETLKARARVRGRALLFELLADPQTGACSVLERGYLDLERRHGLPTVDRRQVPTRPATSPRRSPTVW